MRNNIREMRKSAVLNALLPHMRQGILSSLLLLPDRSWYLSSLAAHLNATPSSLQRELMSLARAGIITSRRDGNRVYYSANPDCAILPELTSMLSKTVGITNLLRHALSCIEREIDVAFIYGSMAANTDTVQSDVDLLVVGKVRLKELAAVLRPLELELARAVNPSLYPAEEFALKFADGNHFLNSVLRGPKYFIIGSESELAHLAERGPHKTALDQQEGGR
jgi:DNA-binding transcriptional ArsR family regulator